MATLREALSAVLRLLAPFVPFVTEEVWSWWQTGSVHLAPWPEPADLLALADADAGAGDGAGAVSLDGTAVLDAAAAAIGAVRRAKSQAQLPMKAPVSQLILTAPQEQLDALAAAAPDVSAAGPRGRDQAACPPRHRPRPRGPALTAAIGRRRSWMSRLLTPGCYQRDIHTAFRGGSWPIQFFGLSISLDPAWRERLHS